MNDECTLREKARQAISGGRLPTRKPDRTLGGLGSGSTCGVCGELNRHGSTPGLDTYHLHPRCFTIWDLVRHTLHARAPSA